MAARTLSDEHILILGATGASGLALIEEITSLGDAGPLATLYVRSTSRSKLPDSVAKSRRFRIVEGALTDRAAFDKALKPSSEPPFPAVTTAMSSLGAAPSLYYFLTRQTPHPIADALHDVVLPAIRAAGVKRVFVLSTPGGFPYPEETRLMTWAWWFKSTLPKVVVPQGHAEMREIANAVVRVGAEDGSLEWTLVRVMFLNDGDAGARVSAGTLFKDFEGTSDLSRGSLAKWLLRETVERKWVRRAPLLGNMP
jgi:nucleoside-diphosphate-sugar epimerase